MNKKINKTAAMLMATNVTVFFLGYASSAHSQSVQQKTLANELNAPVSSIDRPVTSPVPVSKPLPASTASPIPTAIPISSTHTNADSVSLATSAPVFTPKPLVIAAPTATPQPATSGAATTSTINGTTTYYGAGWDGPNTWYGIILSNLNSERTKAGLQPVKLNADLTTLAGNRANDMASGKTTFSHDGFNDLVKAGLVPLPAGEVIQQGNTCSYTIISVFMQSPPHKAILMSPTIKEIGPGVAAKDVVIIVH